jgi:heme oxygenase
MIFGAQGPAIARAAVALSLGQHLCVQQVLEPLLRQAAAGTGPLHTVIQPYHFHLLALQDDLAALNAGPQLTTPLPATVRFVEHVKACGTSMALLGVWYVYEGATNGGTIIGKHVKAVLGLHDDRGTQFINPHGPLVRPRWMAWKTAVDALAISPADRESIIAAASDTFTLTAGMLTEVHDAVLANTPAATTAG